MSRTDNTRPFRLQAIDPRRPGWVRHRAECIAGGRCELVAGGRGQPDGPAYWRCWRDPLFFGGMWSTVRGCARPHEGAARAVARNRLRDAVKLARAALASGQLDELDDVVDVVPIRHRHSGQWDAM